MKQHHSHQSEWPQVPSQLLAPVSRPLAFSALLRVASRHLVELVTLNEQEKRQVLGLYSALGLKLLCLALVGLGVRFFGG